MKATIILSIALAGCAAAPRDDGSRTITVPAERVKASQQGGGCVLVTQQELADFAEQAIAAGMAASDAALDSNGCRKGSL